MKRKSTIIRKGTAFRGVKEAAKKAGCSKTHLHYVLYGKRRAGKALAQRLKQLGITVPEFTPEEK